jgi:hypothetical protein
LDGFFFLAAKSWTFSNSCRNRLRKFFASLPFFRAQKRKIFFGERSKVRERAEEHTDDGAPRTNDVFFRIGRG